MIYIASPYSHPSAEERVANFCFVQKKTAELIKEGHVVYSPIVHSHDIAIRYDLPTDWKFWFNQCSHMLKKADKLLVYMMPGWLTSVGVQAEIELAIALKIPVEYLPYEPE